MRTLGCSAAALVAVPLLISTAAAQSTPFATPAPAGFGAAVVIAGEEIIVGEPGNTRRPGSVYVYRRSGGQWAEAAWLTVPGAPAGDGLGSSIGVSADHLIVGGGTANGLRGMAHVFARSNGVWTYSAALTPSDALEVGHQFGSRVAIEGNLAAVAAAGNTRTPGAVYIYRLTAGTWVQVGRIAAPADAGSGFGNGLAISGASTFVGAPGLNDARGAVLVFRTDPAGSYVNIATVTSSSLQPNDRFGNALSVRGRMLVVGAPFATGRTGAAHVFRAGADSVWHESARLVGYDAPVNARAGTALALSDGELWLGAPGVNGSRGAAYRYWLGGDGAWSGSMRVMPLQQLRSNANFGSAIDVSGDIAAVAVQGEDFGAGSVVIFERSGTEWMQRTVLKSPPETLAAVRGGEVKCGEDGMAADFPCRDVELLSFLPIPEMGGGRGVRLNDIWGWTDPVSGREYALVGRADGTSFVDVTDPINPVFVADLPLTEGANAASWRDVKVYRDHAYVVADGAGPHGMQVLDLTRLRDFRDTPLDLTPDHTYRRINSAHNIVINEESGFAYAVGASSGGETCGGGLHMIDIREPKVPRFAGCFSDAQTGRASTGYSHDAQCVTYRGPDPRYSGREICVGSNETALSIADVTDKSNPKALARASYPNVGYSHQGWLTDDHRYLYMNDELDEMQGQPRTRTMIWDLADLENPRLAGEHLGTEAASDHNLYILGNLMYQSNYRSGLRILDITDRESPREVAFFDTQPAGTNGPGFEGSWSNYPFFRSGIIIVSSIGEGLFVLKKRGATPVF